MRKLLVLMSPVGTGRYVKRLDELVLVAHAAEHIEEGIAIRYSISRGSLFGVRVNLELFPNEDSGSANESGRT